MALSSFHVTAAMTLTSVLTVVLDILSQQSPGLFSTEIYPPDKTEVIRDSTDRVYDFIVVGGGSAGSVVASRLSEMENWTVLLIEAGDDPSTLSDIPVSAFDLQGTSESWDYLVEPQAGVCLSAKDKVCKWAKGKALGGSSVINAMVYVPGNKRDFDNWAAMGNPGWGSDDVSYYFKKSQEMQPDYIAKHGTKDFGAHGPLSIRYWNSSDRALQDIFIQGTKSLGYREMEAFTLDDQIGFGRQPGTIDNGRRMSTAKAYLAPARNRTNLFVLKKALATKVLTEGESATGVEVELSDGDIIVVRARKEVILSAGSIATPQLLMLSGIGPAEHLREMGIEVIKDLPVGKNLHDHFIWPTLSWSYANESSVTEDEQLTEAANDYVSNQEGQFASLLGLDLLGFIKVTDSLPDFPDIQFMVASALRNSTLEVKSVIKALNLDSEVADMIYQQNAINDTILTVTILLHPKSRGEIKLRSTDPNDPPRIYANYLADSADLETMLNAVAFLKDLDKTDTFSRNEIHLINLPLSGCAGYDLDSLEHWECHLRHTGSTIWHPVGTAKMGPGNDSSTVVDPQLRVHGFSNLRVVDASIMPCITSGNTNGPTIMIGEKAADLIKATWQD